MQPEHISDADAFIVCLQREVDAALSSLNDTERLDLEVILQDGTVIHVGHIQTRRPNMVIVHGVRATDKRQVSALIHPTNAQVLLTRGVADKGKTVKIGFHILKDGENT